MRPWGWRPVALIGAVLMGILAIGGCSKGKLNTGGPPDQPPKSTNTDGAGDGKADPNKPSSNPGGP